MVEELNSGEGSWIQASKSACLAKHGQIRTRGVHINVGKACYMERLDDVRRLLSFLGQASLYLTNPSVNSHGLVHKDPRGTAHAAFGPTRVAVDWESNGDLANSELKSQAGTSSSSHWTFAPEVGGA